MSFADSIRICLRQKLLTLSGRAARSEYWWFGLFCLLTLVVLAGLFGGIYGVTATNTGRPAPIFWVALVPLGLLMIWLYVASVTVMVRRFHDRNLSGWWVLVVIVLSNLPYIGILCGIAGLIVTVLKGTEGPNRFGEDPLAPATDADIFA